MQWFELGGELKVPENAPAAEALSPAEENSGSDGTHRSLGVDGRDGPAGMAAAGGIHSRRTVGAQAHQPQRRARLSTRNAPKHAGTARTAIASAAAPVQLARRRARSRAESMKYIRYTQIYGRTRRRRGLWRNLSSAWPTFSCRAASNRNSTACPKWIRKSPWKPCDRRSSARSRKATCCPAGIERSAGRHARADGRQDERADRPVDRPADAGGYVTGDPQVTAPPR